MVNANAQENHNRKILGDTVFAKFSRIEVQTFWLGELR